MSYMLSQIKNMRAAGAGIPDGYEAAAVVEAIIDAWDDWDCIAETAQHGVSTADKAAIERIIAANSLECSVEEAARALYDECVARVDRAVLEQDIPTPILNLTQHTATEDQIEDGVVEPPEGLKAQIARLLTFETLPTPTEIRERAKEICKLVTDHCYPLPPAAMIGGAPYLMSALERELSRRGIMPVYAFSRREAIEVKMEDGSVRKSQIFRHLGFVLGGIA